MRTTRYYQSQLLFRRSYKPARTFRPSKTGGPMVFRPASTEPQRQEPISGVGPSTGETKQFGA